MIAGGLLMYSGATHAAVSPTYFYDELNRLIEVDYDDGTKINYDGFVKSHAAIF
jgi:hypothetical protein